MALDERLRRELERSARPADPAGVYEELIRRRERRTILRRVELVGLAALVIAGTSLGFLTLLRVFTGSEAPPISSSGGAIVYADSPDGRWDLFVAAPDGSDVRRLTDDRADDLSPDWSPDGQRIVFARCESGEDDCDLFVIGADGSSPSRLTDTPTVSETRPRWSPDGTRVLFESTEDGPIRIGLMNADGTNALVMTDETSASGGADWSPDGSQIVFQRSPWTTAGSGAGEIWVMNADGTGQHAITHAPEAAQENGWPVDDEPRWSPDGSLIAFVRGTDVYTVSPDGSNLTDLTPGGGTDASDRGIAWSPDGSRILFASGRGSEYDLYTMNRDGSEARPFLDRSVATCCPEADWSGAATFAETVGPEPTISPTPQDTPDSIGQDIGLGFRVCDVTSVTGRFVPGIEGTAFVATRMGDTGECPPLDGATQVLAVDVDGDGLSDTSYDPLECDQWCNAFAAPDVDRDGDDELLVQNVQFSIKGLKLFEVQLGDGGAGLGPVVVAPPGSVVFEGGTEPQLWLGGDEGNWDAIRCEPFGNGRALVSTTSSHPVDAPGDRIVTETWFVLEGIELRVVDVREYSAPVDDDTQPYLQMDGCGASFPYP